MIIKIDFNSDEAIYMQITNQIIMGIAKRQICDGDQLPSIRNMADEIGINMHTVNKAYTVLRQAGYVKLDRRRGAIVSVDVDKTADSILDSAKNGKTGTIACIYQKKRSTSWWMRFTTNICQMFKIKFVLDENSYFCEEE